MSEYNVNVVTEVELRAGYVEDAMRPGGVVHEIAQAGISEPTNLAPEHVGNILMPPKQPDEDKQARWELIEGAAGAVKQAAADRPQDVFDLAQTLDMKRSESISSADIERIDPRQSVWIIEGGANRTSVVRRQLAHDAAEQVYGQPVELFQFGSDRAIPRQKVNKKDNSLQDNPEYKIAAEIAGDHLPLDDSLTEFGLNVASAKQAGYQMVDHNFSGREAVHVVTMKKGEQTLHLIQPHKNRGGLTDGFEAMNRLGSLEGRQFVIATNGQYRPKDEQQASQWATENGIDMLPPVALGDEPGYNAHHAGKDITTADRAPMAYVNEMVILQRQNDSKQPIQ